ncbi:isochorismate lyase [Salmonella enterica]|nr:isochorismate lyase [Salmonella enterica]
MMIKTSNENKASQCTDMASIRTEIDRIDREVILLLGERYSFVKAASKFKKSPTQVKAEDRFNAMLKERRGWAEEQGLSADLIEKIYRDLVTWFISEEMRHWSEQQPDLT